jgi:hypothetical protein
MTLNSIMIWASVYVVVAPLAIFFLASRKQESLLLKVIGPLFVPGILVWAPLAMIAATIYFWLYRERHWTVIDRNGTEEEKAALAAFRSTLSSETAWHRLMVKLGRRRPTAERLQAEEAVSQVWDRYEERMHPKDHSVAIKRSKKGVVTLQYKDEAGLVEVVIEEVPDTHQPGYLVSERSFQCDATRRGLILDRFATLAGNRKIPHTILKDEAVDQQTAAG